MTLRPASATWSSARDARASCRRRAAARPRRSGVGSMAREAARPGGSAAWRPRSAPTARRRTSARPASPSRPLGRAPSTAASGRLELARSRCGRRHRLSRLERGAERRRASRLVALWQLGLELDEAVDDPAAGHDIDLVEAQLDPASARRLELALAAQLADGHELDERRVAGVLEDERPGVGGRPVDGGGDAIGRTLELLAADGAAGAVGPGERLDRDDRVGAALAEPDRETGAAEGAVGGVDVAVLELHRPGAGARGERPELVGGDEPFGGGEVGDPVLSSSSTWPPPAALARSPARRSRPRVQRAGAGARPARRWSRRARTRARAP